MYTPHSGYIPRIAERVAENLCVRSGELGWKSSESNLIQGLDDSIAILQELIGVLLRIEREGTATRDLLFPLRQLINCTSRAAHLTIALLSALPAVLFSPLLSSSHHIRAIVPGVPVS